MKGLQVIRNLLYLYVGGVIALLFESLVQWLHPEESEANETFGEAFGAAVFWPVMAIISMVEFISSRRNG